MEQNKSVVQTSNQNVMPVAFNFFDPVQFETMQRVSKMFASSDLVPDSYKPVLKMIPAGANEGQIAAIQQENAAAQKSPVHLPLNLNSCCLMNRLPESTLSP